VLNKAFFYFMYIELLGLSGIKIQSGDLVYLASPPSEKSELKASRMKADVVVLEKPGDSINIDAQTEKLFTIDSPGEYEASGIFVYCIANPQKGEPKSLMSSVTIEGISIAHLSGLGHELTDAQFELFEGADVLLIPVGGNGVLDANTAKKVIEKVEPRVVIPMHFEKKGLKTHYDSVEKFFKVMGSTPNPVERIKILKKELPQENLDIIYLKS
jgi:hypothetical protein